MGPLLAQELGPATDFEWELLTPGRTLFRDRTLVGSVPLEQAASQKGKRKKSKTRAAETLSLYIDMAFEPGDTVRYFGANLVLQGEERPLAFAILDPDELAPFQDALRYLLKTAENIRNSQRTDTQILFRGKNDWKVVFRQQGTQQRTEIHFPATIAEKEQQRELEAVQVSALADLVDAAISSLKRQGALPQEMP